MKIQFKQQKFQADAAKAVCDTFTGQPYLTPSYMMDKGELGVGKYNPDWAIALHEGKVKHIYFVAETKGSMSTK